MRISDWSSDVCSSDLLVQGELLVGALRGHHAHGDVGIAAQAAALAAVGDEVTDGDAYRHAGAAVAAVGTVDEVAGAAESPVQCLRVETRHGDRQRRG